METGALPRRVQRCGSPASRHGRSGCRGPASAPHPAAGGKRQKAQLQEYITCLGSVPSCCLRVSGHHTTLLWGGHHITAAAVGRLLPHTLQLAAAALIKQLTGIGCCGGAMCCSCALSRLTSAMVAWGALTHTLQLEVRLLHRKAAAVAMADSSPCACPAVCLTTRRHPLRLPRPTPCSRG